MNLREQVEKLEAQLANKLNDADNLKTDITLLRRELSAAKEKLHGALNGSARAELYNKGRSTRNPFDQGGKQ